jgi:hypothetical protein
MFRRPLNLPKPWSTHLIKTACRYGLSFGGSFFSGGGGVLR